MLMFFLGWLSNYQCCRFSGENSQHLQHLTLVWTTSCPDCPASVFFTQTLHNVSYGHVWRQKSTYWLVFSNLHRFFPVESYSSSFSNLVRFIWADLNTAVLRHRSRIYPRAIGTCSNLDLTQLLWTFQLKGEQNQLLLGASRRLKWGLSLTKKKCIAL